MFLIFFMLLQCMYLIEAQTTFGYICVPVADLVAQPFSPSSDKSMKEQYAAITLSPEQGKSSCLRARQALFNEKVTILAYKNKQVWLELCNYFYKPTPYHALEPVRLWTYAGNVVTEEELQTYEIPLSIFPEPYSYRVSQYATEYVHLCMPWHDPATQITYSVGTRFVIDHSTQSHYIVKIYDHACRKDITAKIPKEITLVPDFSCKQEQRSTFVSLLYRWCSLPGSIPFVWGGCSATVGCSDDIFVLQKVAHGTYWDRPSYGERPFCGFDASGLVLRAAQLCNIPYYCFNTTTIENSLEPLTFQVLEEGDLICAPGYVGIVGSLQRNEIIEAQGYSRGCGKMHIISLSQRFADIKTWHDVLYHLAMTIPLKSLDAQGNIVAYIPTFKIFKLPV